jgi:hypothetical protein
MSLALSAGARAVPAASVAPGARRPATAAAAAAAAPLGRRRSQRRRGPVAAPRADLHGLVSLSHAAALFPPSRPLSGASTPSRPDSSLSGGGGGAGAADPSKRDAFARVLKASLLGLGAALAAGGGGGGGGGEQRRRQQARASTAPPLQPPQRSASPAFQLPPEVLEADEEAAASESSGGWGRSHIAERLATEPASKLLPPSDGGGH